MKVKLAIIGSKIPVNKIYTIAKEFDDLIAIPMICENLLETPSVTSKALDFVDVIVFGGPIPFSLSQSVLQSNNYATYLPYTGTTIYSTLIKIYMKYNFLPTISFEAKDPKDVNEVYEEIGRGHISRYIQVIKGYNPEEIIQHHMKLWNEQKIQVIVTGIQKVYDYFQQLKIPVYFYENTKQSIRETLNKALLMGFKMKQQISQITVLHFQIDNYNPKASEKLKQEYQEIKKKIMGYGKNLFSILGDTDESSVTLYVTRGVLKTRDFSILKEIETKFSHTVSIGVGLGETANSAAYNAQKALQFSRQNGGNCVFLIDERKTVHGPLGNSRSLEYSLMNVTPGDFNSISLQKFYAWLRMMKKIDVTTREVTIGMNISSRHASRILKQLHEKGIAKIIGKESLNQKGRPRLIYRINILEFANELGIISKDSSDDTC